MKHFIKASLLLMFTIHSSISFSQKKTILIPKVFKIKNGENFVGKIDGLSFYVMSKTGKAEKLIVKDSAGNPGKIVFHATYKKKSNSGIEQSCEACVGVNEGGTWTYRCYEIDCVGANELKGNSLKASWINFSYPKKPTSGSYLLYKDEFVEIKAVYKNGIIENYNTTNLKGIKYSIDFEQSNVSNATTTCIRKTKTTLPDGSVIITSSPIDCNKLPKPKGPTNTQ